jgi:hypothetical protein
LKPVDWVYMAQHRFWNIVNLLMCHPCWKMWILFPINMSVWRGF